jgi:hypothetical protein
MRHLKRPCVGGVRLALLGWVLAALTAAIGSCLAPSVFQLYHPTAAVMIEVATVPGNTFSTAASFGGGAMDLATGSYAGNGLDNVAIGGVGFMPDLVLVKCECNRSGVARTRTMTGDAAKVFTSTGALAPNLVQSLDLDGFTVGADASVNRAGDTYHWAAMREGAELKLGTYLGNGADNRSVAGVGFQPCWVATFGDGADSIFRPSTLTGDASFAITGGGALTNRIQQLEAGGFQVGSNPDVNQAGVTYHYAAWGASANAGQASYAGNGADNRSIGGLGFQPRLVWIKAEDNSSATWRTASLSGDLSLAFDVTVASSNRIQLLEPDGFQVGSNAQVNRSGRSYHYLALRDGVP